MSNPHPLTIRRAPNAYADLLLLARAQSPRLLDHLAQLLRDGRFASSESFASTACAIAAERGHWRCVLGDWANTPRWPGSSIQSRVSGGPRMKRVPPREMAANRSSSWRHVPGLLPPRNYRGPHYWFYPARFAYVESYCDVCNEACDSALASELQDRWHHPVGELKTRLAIEHPSVERYHRRGRDPARRVGRCMLRFPDCGATRGGDHSCDARGRLSELAA